MTVVIINPMSGAGRGTVESRGRDRLARAEQVLRHASTPSRVVLTKRPGHGAELAREAVASGASLVCAWGGDGTANEIASVLAFSRVPLGLVPNGSGNGLARELGVSLKPGAALRQALTGTDRLLDVGEIGGRLFFNVAGIGFDAHVARLFNESGRRRGFTAYIKTSLVELFRYHARRYAIALPADDVAGGMTADVDANLAPGMRTGNHRVSGERNGSEGHASAVATAANADGASYARAGLAAFDVAGTRDAALRSDADAGERLQREALMVVIANTAQYGNGARIAPHAKPDDGRLDLVVVSAQSALANVWESRRMFDGSLARARHVLMRSITTADIAMLAATGRNGAHAASGSAAGAAPDDPIIVPFHVDGEPAKAASPLHVRVHPRALKVRVPAASDR